MMCKFRAGIYILLMTAIANLFLGVGTGWAADKAADPQDDGN